MEIHSMMPDLLLRSLEGADQDGVLRAIESARSMGDGPRQVLTGMRRFGALHAPRDGEIQAEVVIDMVADLIATMGPDSCWDLLVAAAAYLMSLPTSVPRVDLFEPAAGERPPDFVPISSLGDALAGGDLAEICRTAGRLVRVIHSREYFLEIVLEAVAPDPTPAGRRLILADSAVKAIHSIGWDPGKGIAYRLFEALSESAIEPPPPVTDTPPPTPCRAAFLATVAGERIEDPESAWLYLSHAFQAERYAQLRPKAIRWGARRWMAEHLFDGDAGRMDAAESDIAPARDAATAAGSSALPPDLHTRIVERVALGSPDIAAEAAEQARAMDDVDPLYRAIAQGAVMTLAHGDPWPLLAVNGARWGAHLLGRAGAGEITDRLIRRLSEMRAAERSTAPDEPAPEDAE